MDHTNHCEQATKGPRCAKRHICQNCPNHVFQEHNRYKHQLCMKQEEEQSPYFDYIFVSMRNSLDDQTTYAKVYSIHCYKQ